MGSKSNVGENTKTISIELKCLREEVCMPPGLFNRKIMNNLDAMYSEEDVVVVENCTQFNKEEINSMLAFLCIT